MAGRDPKPKTQVTLDEIKRPEITGPIRCDRCGGDSEKTERGKEWYVLNIPHGDKKLMTLCSRCYKVWKG